MNTISFNSFSSATVASVANTPMENAKNIVPQTEGNIETGFTTSCDDVVEVKAGAENSENSGVSETSENLESQKPAKKGLEKRIVGALVRHPKATFATLGAGAVAMGVAGVVAGTSLGDIADVVGDMGGSSVSDKCEFYAGAANLVGADAAAGAVVGASGIAGLGTYKSVTGVDNLKNGAKKRDLIKLGKGLRGLNTGLKKGLAAGSVVSMGFTGSAGAIGVASSVLAPGIKVASTVLNTGIGVLQLKKGIQNKDKKEILDGAISLGVGVATGVSLAIGCVPVAVACTVFGTARDCFNVANHITRISGEVKEAKAEIAAEKMAKEQANNELADKDKSIEIESQKTVVSDVKGALTANVDRADSSVNADKLESVDTELSPELLALLNSSPEDALFIDG